MKISVDLDGTLYAHQAFFRLLFCLYRSVNHEVGILTGHSAESEAHDRAKLAEMGIVPSFYFGRTPAYIQRNGMYFKRDMIVAHAIDLHFDDLDYGLSDTVEILATSSIDIIRRVVIMPHKGNGVRSE